MDHPNNGCPFQSSDDRVNRGRGRRDALHLPGKTSLAEEFVRSKNCEDCFLALLGNDGEPHLALLGVKAVTSILPKDYLAFAVLADAPTVPDMREKRCCIE